MPPDCPAQPFRQHNKRWRHRSRIGTMAQKYNWISLKFNDLRFAYFGEIGNERNEMNAESIPFIAMTKTLSQYQCRVVQKLVYHRMIDGSIGYGCNGCNFIPSVFG